MFSKRNPLIAAMFNDTIHLPFVGKVSVLELVGIASLASIAVHSIYMVFHPW